MINLRETTYKNGSVVLRGPKAVNRGSKEKPIFEFPSVTGRQAGHLLHTLIVPDPPPPPRDSPLYIPYLALRAKLPPASEALTDLLADAFVGRFMPHETYIEPGRMGDPIAATIPAFSVPPALTLLELVRGGSFASPRFLRRLREFFPLIDDTSITVCGQRKGNSIKKLRTDPTLKGYVPDLDERDCIIVDPILATGVSAETGIERMVERCDGKRPRSLTLLCFHATERGIRTLAKKYPGIRIIALAIHLKLNGLGYLLRPGVSDYGAVWAGCTDERPDAATLEKLVLRMFPRLIPVTQAEAPWAA